MHEQFNSVANAYAFSAPISLEVSQRQELRDELEGIYAVKDGELKTHFGLRDQDPPRHGKELVERIKTGEYVLLGEREFEDSDRTYYSQMTYGIRWRNPKVKVDREGYKLALEKMEKAHTSTKLDVIVLPLTEALASVRAFEEKKFH
jgi:hypothetical protein